MMLKSTMRWKAANLVLFWFQELTLEKNNNSSWPFDAMLKFTKIGIKSNKLPTPMIISNCAQESTASRGTLQIIGYRDS